MKKKSLCNKKEGGMKSLLYHITHLWWIFHVGLQARWWKNLSSSKKLVISWAPIQFTSFANSSTAELRRAKKSGRRLMADSWDVGSWKDSVGVKRVQLPEFYSKTFAWPFFSVLLPLEFLIFRPVFSKVWICHFFLQMTFSQYFSAVIKLFFWQKYRLKSKSVKRRDAFSLYGLWKKNVFALHSTLFIWYFLLEFRVMRPLEEVVPNF